MIESLKPATHSRELIDQCYRALLEISSTAILLLSPASIILGWNRGAETASEVSAALFRIAQELLTNVMRHAAASQVCMRLYQDSAMVTLEVTDNGKGVSRERTTTPHAFGLRGIQERASPLGGYFHIVGTSGIETTAIASVPVAECFTS